jgi:hypothetical protein
MEAVWQQLKLFNCAVQQAQSLDNKYNPISICDSNIHPKHTTGGGCGDPPQLRSRRQRRSKVGRRGAAAISAAMVLATFVTLMRSRSVGRLGSSSIQEIFSSVRGREGLLNAVPWLRERPMQSQHQTSWWTTAKRELVTSNDKPRLVAFRYIIEASIGVS